MITFPGRWRYKCLYSAKWEAFVFPLLWCTIYYCTIGLFCFDSHICELGGHPHEFSGCQQPGKNAAIVIWEKLSSNAQNLLLLKHTYNTNGKTSFTAPVCSDFSISVRPPMLLGSIVALHQALKTGLMPSRQDP